MDELRKSHVIELANARGDSTVQSPIPSSLVEGDKAAAAALRKLRTDRDAAKANVESYPASLAAKALLEDFEAAVLAVTHVVTKAPRNVEKEILSLDKQSQAIDRKLEAARPGFESPAVWRLERLRAHRPFVGWDHIARTP